MGWTEGQGLGLYGQGMLAFGIGQAPLEASGRPQAVVPVAPFKHVASSSAELANLHKLTCQAEKTSAEP